MPAASSRQNPADSELKLSAFWRRSALPDALCKPGGQIKGCMLRKLLAIEVSSSELREITDFLVILSVAVLAYLATSWIVVGNFFDIQLVRAAFFVAVALATSGIRRERETPSA